MRVHPLWTGPKGPASARPALGGRWPLVVSGCIVFGGQAAHGRGNALRFLIRPGQAKAMAFANPPPQPAASPAKSAATRCQTASLLAASSTPLRRASP